MTVFAHAVSLPPTFWLLAVLATLLVGYATLEEAGDAVAAVIAGGLLPGAIEIMDALAIRAAQAAVHADYPAGCEAVLIVELEGPREAVAADRARLEAILATGRPVAVRAARDADERLAIWKGRKSAFSAVGRLSPDFAPDVTEYSVLLPFGSSATPALVAAASDPAASLQAVDAADVTSTDATARTSTLTVTAEDGVTTRVYAVRFDVSPYKTLYDFQVTDIHGEPFDLASLKGKKVLVVNVASYCGFTPQYPKLQQLYDTYGPDAFAVIGFPANNFGGQEPGTDQEICDFAVTKYGITFPLMSKISVQGFDMHPVYAWLTQKSENGVLDAPV